MKVRFKAALKRRVDPKPRTKRPEVQPASRAARMLALAHYVEGLVERGQVEGYADAARRLEITRARMTQVMNLLNLSPRLQEALLLGKARLSERKLRTVVAIPEWEAQHD